MPVVLEHAEAALLFSFAVAAGAFCCGSGPSADLPWSVPGSGNDRPTNKSGPTHAGQQQQQQVRCHFYHDMGPPCRRRRRRGRRSCMGCRREEPVFRSCGHGRKRSGPAAACHSSSAMSQPPVEFNNNQCHAQQPSAGLRAVTSCRVSGGRWRQRCGRTAGSHSPAATASQRSPSRDGQSAAAA